MMPNSTNVVSSTKLPAKLPSLSIFFPCFNEEKNVPIMVNQALKILPEVAEKFEIIVVNDGSSDQTRPVAEKLATQYPQVKLVNHQQNQGYGATVRTGFDSCQYDWIFFTDGDAQFDLQELIDFTVYAQDYQAILGYRRQRADGFKRALFAKLYKFYIDALFRVHVKDIDCAFKLIKADLIKDLEFFSNGAFISSELLYKLKKKKVQFKQLPVNHYQRRHGKSTGANLRVIAIGLLEPLKLYLKMKFNLNMSNI
jgi:glycosyltransferase involved in cell wall biosynthesis